MKTQYLIYRFAFVCCVMFTLVSCNAQNNKSAFQVYGADFNESNVTTQKNMIGFYNKTSAEDSLQVTFKAKVNSVCKMKGCWMKLALDNNKEVMVKFKDYGFFVPTDIEGKEVIVSGKAFVSLVSVDEQKHYAKDAGKSEKEIAAITKPSKTYSFEANGVKMKK